MKAKKDYGIWGQFGSGGQIADGQAIRTTIITKDMIKRYGKDKIDILNTYNWSKNPLLFLWKSILLVIKNKKVIILPADNGFKIFVPVLYMVNFLFKRKIYYVVIGGFLPELLKRKRWYVSILKNFEALFVQTNHLKKELEFLDLENIYILSNLKQLNKAEEKEVLVNDDSNVTVCTFSRVTSTKGIEEAIKGVKLVNEKLGGNLIKLDIFGVIDENYRAHFQALLSSNSEYVEYKGILKYDETVSTLKNYYALLFPTYYHGEGFPGSIIDAFYSGLPIIATDWMSNKEIIKDYYNGILIPTKDPKAISDALYELYYDKNMTNKMKINNLKESDNYNPKLVLEEFYSLID